MAREQHVLVCYDITDDRARKQFAEELLDLGLARKQYSLFEGTIPAKRVRNVTDVCEKYKNMMNNNEITPSEVGCSIEVIELCGRCEERIHRYSTDESDETTGEKSDDFTIH